jgi:hypothetical protein
MPDFNVRADAVNVEQIMDQIRARIREKRGVDYTEDQIRELASVKLEKFLDPRGVRSDLLDQFKRAQVAQAPPAPPNYRFEEDTLFETHRGFVRFIRRLLQPLLKLMFNPGPLIQALHIQSQLNTLNAQQDTARRGLDQLHFEVLHNLVLETTRMGIEVKNLKMRVESLTSRLEFNERRARALESVVVYKPSETAEIAVARTAPAPQPERPRQQDRSRNEPRDRDRNRPPQEPRYQAPPPEAPAEPAPPTAAAAPSVVTEGATGAPEGPGQRSRRRRRRRGRRGGGSVAAQMGGAPTVASTMAPVPTDEDQLEPDDVDAADTDFSSLIDSSTTSGFREEPVGALPEAPVASRQPETPAEQAAASGSESNAATTSALSAEWVTEPEGPESRLPDEGTAPRESQGRPEPGRGTPSSDPDRDQ